MSTRFLSFAVCVTTVWSLARQRRASRSTLARIGNTRIRTKSAEEARVALLPQHERKRRRVWKMRGQLGQAERVEHAASAACLQMLTQARRQALVHCTIKAADVGFRKCSYRDISFPALEVGLACLGRCLLGCLLPGWRNNRAALAPSCEKNGVTCCAVVIGYGHRRRPLGSLFHKVSIG